MMSIRSVFFSLIICCLGAVPARAGVGCLAADCHAGFASDAYVHAPVAAGECDSCHAPTDIPHPGPGSMQLSEQDPELCLQCHEDPAAGMAYPHSALAEGCTGCHNPHQGGLPALVLRPGGELCLTCHDDTPAVQAHEDQEAFFTAEAGGLELLKFGVFPESGKVWPDNPGADFEHGPAAAGSCRICHASHGGDSAALMKLPGNQICLACHVDIREIIDSAVSQHEPVARGRCWECHTAHASDYKPYLRGYYPRDLYVPYEEENFALCFNCHDKNAFAFERTSEATEFRNGDENLHYFHVNRPEKGRVCKNCHGVHGADQDKLLMSKVPGFGSWDIPLVWAREGDRATCYVGCHRPKTYDRSRKIVNR